MSKSVMPLFSAGVSPQLTCLGCFVIYFQNEKLDSLPHVVASHIYPDSNILVDESPASFLNDVIR